MRPLTRSPWNTAHRDVHHLHRREIWMASLQLQSGGVRTNISAPAYPAPLQCLPVHFFRTIVVQGSFNRLKPPAISGEMTTPSGMGACEVQSTGTGNHEVFTHAAPHSDPCAILQPDDDVNPPPPSRQAEPLRPCVTVHPVRHEHASPQREPRDELFPIRDKRRRACCAHTHYFQRQSS